MKDNKEYQRQYYKKNKAKLTVYKKAWYEKNRESVIGKTLDKYYKRTEPERIKRYTAFLESCGYTVAKVVIWNAADEKKKLIELLSSQGYTVSKPGICWKHLKADCAECQVSKPGICWKHLKADCAECQQ